MIRQRSRSATITLSLCVAFGITQTLLLVLALFPLLPGHLRVSVGEIASQTITAPRSFSFSSDVVRQQLQQQAASSAADVIAFDAGVSDRQLSQLDQAVAAIQAARSTGGLTAAPVGVLDRAGPVPISAAVRSTLQALTSDQWTSVVAEAHRVLGQVLQEPFTTDGVQAKRATVPTRVAQNLSSAERDVVVALVQPLAQATETVDSTATEAQRQRLIAAVPPQIRHFAANQDIVRQGEPIDASDIEALRAAGLLDAHLPISDLLAVSLVAVAAALALSSYLFVFQPVALTSYRRLLPLAALIAIVVLLGKLYFPFVLPDGRRFLALALPVAVAPMLVVSLFETPMALLTAAVITALVGFAAIYLPQLSGYVGITALQLLQLVLTFLLGGFAGIYLLRSVDRLSRYFVAGAAVALAGFLGAVAIWCIDPSKKPVDLLWIALACAVSGALSSLLTAGIAALLGPLFGITTRLQLLELGRLTAPLLQRLQEEAPGTFHHSILVGNLAGPAAAIVGADTLLVRVGCYYHDVGKLVQPGCFAENQSGGESLYDRLAPMTSAQIIADHVRHGVELARQYRLPDAVTAFISEHHGTQVALDLDRQPALSQPEVEGVPVTYPGPRPRSRETAIVLLADSAEAAVRAVPEHSREHLDAIVDAIIDEQLLHGQLDDCDLTLRDLRAIAGSFKLSLRALYRSRIEYATLTPLDEARRRRAVGDGDSVGD